MIPFARALALLGAYTPADRWLGNRELAARTGLPASTVARLAQSLLHLGYLHRDVEDRKYRLAPAVLSLGYASTANVGIRGAARARMQAFADLHHLDLTLWSRDRLELTVVESCRSPQDARPVNLGVGARTGVACSPVGWTLLAMLPEVERFYLMESLERRALREWPTLRRRMCEAMSQVKENGWCLSMGEWVPNAAIAAAPLLLEGRSPVVIACIGDSSQMTRSRLQREIAPRLAVAAAEIGQAALLS